MSTERISFEWSFKQGLVEKNDCGILAEQAGPIAHLSELEVETLAATLEAMRGNELTESDDRHRVELEVSTVLCAGAATLARASQSGKLRACDRLLFDLLRDYSNGVLLDQEAEFSVYRFEEEVKMIRKLSDQVESLQPDQLQSIKAQLDEVQKLETVGA